MYFDAEEFGKRVAALRQEKGFSQIRLAEEINVSRNHMSYIERGQRVPSLDLMIEMADYFGVSLDYLVLGRSLSPDRARCRAALLEAIGLLTDLESLYEDS